MGLNWAPEALKKNLGMSIREPKNLHILDAYSEIAYWLEEYKETKIS